MHEADILVVGAGQAGAQLAISLRHRGFQGSILLVGEETDAPYERPPLSKEYLAGEKEGDRLLLHPMDLWSQRDVALRLGTRVTAVDANTHVAMTDGGARITYRTLVWAAGGRPRPLPVPGGDLGGVHVIRTRAHVDALRANLEQARDIVVIGGGYIGLEAAAVLVKKGKRVTVLEAQDRVLVRVAAEPISRFYESEHRAHGVDVRTNVDITLLKGRNNRVEKLVLSGGEELPAQLVIVGIGLIPNQSVLAQAGANCCDGVEVDAYCRTNLPDIFAIGDCSNHPNPYAGGERVRLESVQNAVDQAKTVAGVIMGESMRYHALPWFWSNQYDLKLQTAGLHHGFDETMLRGSATTRSFSLIYLLKGRVIAVDAVNNTSDFVGGKMLIELGGNFDPALLTDVAVPLRTLASKDRVTPSQLRKR